MAWAGKGLAALCAVAVLGGCGAAAPSTDGFDASTIGLDYICANQFKVTNRGTVSIGLTWTLDGSSEQGSVTLPAPSTGVASTEATFTTIGTGSVSLWSGSTLVRSAQNGHSGCSTPTKLLVSPATQAVVVGGKLQFAATLTAGADTRVAWSVAEGAAGGTIDSDGLYLAPAAAGTFHVVVKSLADGTLAATATLTVTPRGIAVDPPSLILVARAKRQFAAHFLNPDLTETNDAAPVAWLVQEGPAGGDIDNTGLYVAPATPGTFHIVATSSSSNVGATATVTVQAPVSVAIAPVAAIVAPRGTLQLSATVTSSGGTGVTWLVQEGVAGGLVSGSGLYTAPATPGTYHVVATSSADRGASATAELTVPPPPVQVAVHPASSSLPPSGTLQLTATVTGSADQGVTWTVREGADGGLIDANGFYTAPSAVGTYHVVATSTADPRSSATAAIAVHPAAAPNLGQWGPVEDWPVDPIAAVLLPNGKVLAWSRLEQPGLWDPSSNTFTSVPSPSWEFCAGQTLLPDGKVIVTGGHIDDEHGLPDVNVFDWTTSSWIKMPPMANGRWYPSAITLNDGSVLVAAGEEQDTSPNLIPEVSSPDGKWRRLTGASLQLPDFPRFYNAPNGKVYMAGPNSFTRYLDTAGTGRWTDGPTAQWGNRDYGASAMYAPGKIMLAGGGMTPTNTVEVLDLNAATPSWRYVQSMSFARRMNNLTILPDGKLLMTGGSSGAGFNDESRAVFTPELWDPATEKWTLLPNFVKPRVYHSVALLMPDARVLSGGGGQGGNGSNQSNIEMYSPPYLFNPDGTPATRPGISAAPGTLSYGATFSVSSPDAASIATVVLIRLPAVTHTFNTTQRRIPLPFTNNGDGTLTVSAATNANAAPPGHYMLFILDGQGVPSVAKILKLGN